jgi:hypothetical protein
VREIVLSGNRPLLDAYEECHSRAIVASAALASNTAVSMPDVLSVHDLFVVELATCATDAAPCSAPASSGDLITAPDWKRVRLG